MIVAINSITKLRTEAKEGSKENVYYCIDCQQCMKLRKGKIIQPYFAHDKQREIKDCIFIDYESKYKGYGNNEHNLMKSIVKTLCVEKIVKFEVILKSIDGTRNIADIVIDGKYVIEVQNYPMNVVDWIERTLTFYQNEKEVIWLFNHKLFVTDHYKDGEWKLSLFLGYMSPSSNYDGYFYTIDTTDNIIRKIKVISSRTDTIVKYDMIEISIENLFQHDLFKEFILSQIVPRSKMLNEERLYIELRKKYDKLREDYEEELYIRELNEEEEKRKLECNMLRLDRKLLQEEIVSLQIEYNNLQNEYNETEIIKLRKQVKNMKSDFFSV